MLGGGLQNGRGSKFDPQKRDPLPYNSVLTYMYCFKRWPLGNRNSNSKKRVGRGGVENRMDGQRDSSWQFTVWGSKWIWIGQVNGQVDGWAFTVYRK